MKRSRSSSNLVELGLGAPLLPSKKLHRALLSSSASSEQLAERLRLSTTGTHPFHAAHMTMPTVARRPILATFMPRPRALDTFGAGARHPALRLPQHIITLKLHEGCQDDDDENHAPHYPSSSSCVPAWAPPPAYDGPCHDDHEGYPRPLMFKKQSSYSCPSPTRSASTATTAPTSSSGSYISDSELLESDVSSNSSGGSGTSSASSAPTEADIMHELVREMERLYKTQQQQLQQQQQQQQQQQAARAKAVRSKPRRAFSLHCREDEQ